MSGIYISGIDFPTHKTIAVVIHPDGEAYSAEMHVGVCTKYLEDCKAVAVPDHGRLGDLDELAGRIKAWITHNRRAITEDIEPYVTAIFCGIQETPTIIPADKEEE